MLTLDSPDEREICLLRACCSKCVEECFRNVSHQLSRRWVCCVLTRFFADGGLHLGVVTEAEDGRSFPVEYVDLAAGYGGLATPAGACVICYKRIDIVCLCLGLFYQIGHVWAH